MRAREPERPYRVVNCAELAERDWRFVADEIEPTAPVEWVFHDAEPRNGLEARVRRPKLSRYRACLVSAIAARRSRSLIISHMPRTSCWVAVFAWLLRVRAPHIAFSFNFTDLPGTLMTMLMRRAFRSVTVFVVYSDYERGLYSEVFGVPIDRFTVLPWTMDVPRPEPSEPMIDGDYVCAVGGEGRDYDTFVEAARQLPNVPFVLVPRRTPSGELPENLDVLLRLTPRECWNVIAYSRVSVVPLLTEMTTCGHITVVASELLGRPVVVTSSLGLEDYVTDGSTALICEPANPAQLADRIQRLWSDAALAREIAERARDRSMSDHDPAIWTTWVQQQIDDFVAQTGGPESAALARRRGGDQR